YRLRSDGSEFSIVHQFSGGTGSQPRGDLWSDGAAIYGTATRSSAGGSYGTVFRIPLDGSEATALHTFNGTDGAWPVGGVVGKGDQLYGTTARGGAFDVLSEYEPLFDP